MDCTQNSKQIQKDMQFGFQNLNKQQKSSKRQRLSVCRNPSSVEDSIQRSLTDQLTNKRKMSLLDFKLLPLLNDKRKDNILKDKKTQSLNPQVHHQIHTIRRPVPDKPEYQTIEYSFNRESNVQNLRVSEQSFKDRKQKVRKHESLPSIIKSIVESQNLKKFKTVQLKLDESQNEKNQCSPFDWDSIQSKNFDNVSAFRKMKSQNLSFLKHKFKVTQALKTNRYKKQNLDIDVPQPKRKYSNQLHAQQVAISRQNQAKPSSNEKRFYISNLKLDRPQIINEVLAKKNYIMKLVDKREKQLNIKLLNRKVNPSTDKNSENIQNMAKPLIVLAENNMVSKKLISTSPNQLLLRKLNMSPKNQQKQQKYERFMSLNRSRGFLSNEAKIVKDPVIGWDINGEMQENQFSLNEI